MAVLLSLWLVLLVLSLLLFVFVFVLPNTGTVLLLCSLEDDDIELEEGPELTSWLLSESMFDREGIIGCGLVGREGRRGRRVGRGLIAKVPDAADEELDCFAFEGVVDVAEEDEGAESRV